MLNIAQDVRIRCRSVYLVFFAPRGILAQSVARREVRHLLICSAIRCAAAERLDRCLFTYLVARSTPFHSLLCSLCDGAFALLWVQKNLVSF